MTGLDDVRLTRAGLVKAGAAAAVGIGVAPGARQLALPGSSILAGRSSSPPYLRHETYVPLVGDTFRIERAGASPLKVRLVEARRLAGTGESFSLLFRSNGAGELGSALHRVAHRSLGTFGLFLGPVGRPAEGQELEALVNRITHAGGANV